jgi:2-oxoglutarate dehydrogenase E2 component (dihydrolipoamide succinyltransferase)
MPKLGESIMEATILKWHKKPGDKVEMDETVLDIATDKVDSEVPSTAEGTITEILYNENDVVPVGQVIARVNTNGDNFEAIPDEQKSAEPEHEEADVVEEVPYQPEEKRTVNNGGSGIRFYSPLVLNIASSEGISMSELENIEGTGQDGRVSKKDIMTYLENRKSAPQHQRPATSPSSQVHEVPATTSRQYAPTVYTGNVEIIEMDRMRKMIAKHMIDSQNTSAHVTSFSE